MYPKSLKLIFRNKLTMDRPTGDFPAGEVPAVKHFDQNGSNQRMNPNRSHDPENEADFWDFFFRLRKI